MCTLALTGTILFALAPAGLDAAGDAARALHDTHCLMCHDTRVYTRANRIAKDYGALRAQVDFWQRNMSLNWDRSEIDTVTGYLAGSFYKLPCPDSC